MALQQFGTRGCARGWNRSPCIRALLLVWAVFVAGCAVDHVTPVTPEADLPDRSAAVKLDVTDRASASSLLGEPLIASQFWQFDLFLESIVQTDQIYAVTPWPVPFARLKDEIRRYTLIAYDDSGRAMGVASGLFRRPAKWRNVSPIESTLMSLHLRAGELLFYVDPEGAREVNLLATPAGRDAYLEYRRGTDQCTLVLGCGSAACGDALTVDEGNTDRLPIRQSHSYWLPVAEQARWLQGIVPPDGSQVPWLEALVAVSLSPGYHRLAFSSRYIRGGATLELDCVGGEVGFVVINSRSNDNQWRPALVDWQFERTTEMPEAFTRRPLVLMDDGRWYVEEVGSVRGP